MSAYPHYFKALPAGCTHIDVYRVLSLFEVSDPALQHAVKKLLCAGARGAKDQGQDIAEAIATLQRWQQMRAEECPQVLLEAMRGSTPQPVEFGPVPDPSRDPVAEGFRRKAERGHVTYPAAAPEDAERAAYLARWAGMPVWMRFLSEDSDGCCKGWEYEPQLQNGTWIRPIVPGMWGFLVGARNLLGSIKCEPRPTPEGGQGVEG